MKTKKHHEIQKVVFERGNLILRVDGQTHRFPISKISPKLAKATPMERNKFETSPVGYGIHWPGLDEDLSIDGLLGITHRPLDSKNV
ncbi:MAG: DUF2442 domain-containing protein [Verrucomicrobiota bacterium]|nr:DUF2442 domain-containing protein [Verrucomicrobiota bacterium]